MKKYVLLAVLALVAIRFLKGSEKPQVTTHEVKAPTPHLAELTLKREGIRDYWTPIKKN